jgi:hypothetical protein
MVVAVIPAGWRAGAHNPRKMGVGAHDARTVLAAARRAASAVTPAPQEQAGTGRDGPGGSTGAEILLIGGAAMMRPCHAAPLRARCG